MRKWKVIEFGSVPQETSPTCEYTCMNCMKDALLPVVGRVIAQIEEGLVFDDGRRAIPKQIQCPHCRKRMEAT